MRIDKFRPTMGLLNTHFQVSNNNASKDFRTREFKTYPGYRKLNNDKRYIIITHTASLVSLLNLQSLMCLVTLNYVENRKQHMNPETNKTVQL